MQMRIMEKIRNHFLVIAVAAITLGCILPLYMYGYYTVPLADDFGMILPAHQAWQESGNIIEVFLAAVKWAVLCYETWAGDYICMFLQCLPVGLGDYRLYFVSGWLILSIFIFSIYYAGKVFFVDYLYADKKKSFVVSSVILIYMIQFLPDLYDAFYWYTTAVAYTLSFAVKLILAAAVFKELFVRDEAHKVRAVLLTVLCFLSGAFECSFTQTGFFLIISAFFAFCLFNGEKRLQAGFYWIATTIGWLITLLAPGNMARQEQGYGGTSGVPEVIWESMHRGVESISDNLSLPLLLVTLVSVPAIYGIVKDSRCEYRLPGLFTLFSAAIYASCYAPWIFSRGTEYPSPYGGDSGYVTNVFWCTFVILWFANVIYWSGWAVENFGVAIPEPDWEKEIKLKRSYYGVLVFLICFWSLRLEHVMEYASPRLLWHLANGNAKAYYAAMEERETLLLGEPEELLVVPKVEMPIGSGGAGDITPDETNWVNEGVAVYYGLEYGVRTGE